MDMPKIPVGQDAPWGHERHHRNSDGRRADQVRSRQGERRAVCRPVPAHRDVLSVQLRFPAAYPVRRRRPLRHAGCRPPADHAGRRSSVPPGRRADHGRRSRSGRKGPGCAGESASSVLQRREVVQGPAGDPARQIAHFFQHYKDLEKGKWVKIKRWGDAEEAAKIIQHSIDKYDQTKQSKADRWRDRHPFRQPRPGATPPGRSWTV